MKHENANNDSNPNGEDGLHAPGISCALAAFDEVYRPADPTREAPVHVLPTSQAHSPVGIGTLPEGGSELVVLHHQASLAAKRSIKEHQDLKPSNKAMNTLDNTLNSPSQPWDEYLRKQSWQQDAQPDSVREAFREAIRRGFSKAEAFCDVAETIHRSFIPVNWGLLNYKWKQVLSEPDETSGKVVANLGRNGPGPFRPSNSCNHSTPTTRPNGTWNGHQNGHRSYSGANSAKYKQRGGASLVSYYL
jgi:hypothetical protein